MKSQALFFYLAVLGWILSLAIHLTAVIGNYPIQDSFKGVFILHIGVFIVFFPAILLSRKDPVFKDKEYTLKVRKSPKLFFNTLFKNAPGWVKIVAIVGFYYAVVNFFLSAFVGQSTLSNSQGNQVEDIMRGFSEKVKEARMFSGHWIAFYGFSAAMLFPPKQKREPEAY